MTKKNRRRIEALRAMATQHASPNERDIALRKLRAVEAREATDEEVHAFVYERSFYSYIGFCPRPGCGKDPDDPVHDLFAPRRRKAEAEREAARRADEAEREQILRRYEHGAFKGVTIRAGGAGIDVDYKRQG